MSARNECLSGQSAIDWSPWITVILYSQYNCMAMRKFEGKVYVCKSKNFQLRFLLQSDFCASLREESPLSLNIGSNIICHLYANKRQNDEAVQHLSPEMCFLLELNRWSTRDLTQLVREVFVSIVVCSYWSIDCLFLSFLFVVVFSF